MKRRSNSYHMLISSLPALPPRFDVDRLPITFERLQGRLRMLEPEDAEEIERMLAVLRWADQFEEPSDAAVVQRYDALMQDITNPLVRDILAYRMDVRMIAVALRCRHRGLALPTVGMGQWFDTHPSQLQPARLQAGPGLSLDPGGRAAARARGFADPLPAVCAGGNVDVPEETR